MKEVDDDHPRNSWDWQFYAACQNKDETLFFHPPGERGSTRRRRDALAKAICATCPVMMQCREQSLRVREPYGVWGGLSEHEREALLEPLGAEKEHAPTSPEPTAGTPLLGRLHLQLDRDLLDGRAGLPGASLREVHARGAHG